MSECLMLLVKGTEAQALIALRVHGFDTTDYRVHEGEYPQVAFFIHNSTSDDRRRASEWMHESAGSVPEGGYPPGELLLYNTR